MHNHESSPSPRPSPQGEGGSAPAPGASPAKKLFIGLPIYAQVPTQFLQCLLALQACKPVDCEIHICQGDGVARSRNQLTASFLASDCTHLLFIDCDLVFTPEHVARILAHDVPIVGGLYPKKQEGPVEWVLNTALVETKPTPTKLQEVRYVGTGFMCIKREVITAMIARYPEIEFTADYGTRRQEHDLWPMGVYVYHDGGRRYLSEDYFFCQRAIDMGLPVLADTGCVLSHVGTVIFPLQSQRENLFKHEGAEAVEPVEMRRQTAEIEGGEAPPAGFLRQEHRACDLIAWRECCVWNDYGLPEMFAPDSVVIDVGAHIGCFGYAALERGAARVFSFEPDAENCAHLQRNVRNSGFKERWNVNGSAVAARNGTRTFQSWRISGDNSGEGRLCEQGSDRVWAMGINDVIETATEMGRYRVAFLKLDCEGAEFEILRSGNLALVDEVAAEMHTQNEADVQGVLLLLAAQGFTVGVHAHPRLDDRTMLRAHRRALDFSGPAKTAPATCIGAGVVPSPGNSDSVSIVERVPLCHHPDVVPVEDPQPA